MYADIQFLLNFAIDLLILYFLRALVKSQVPLWRLMLAACVGASTIFFILFPALAILNTFIGKLVTSTIIVLIAFGYHSPIVFLRQFSLFYFIFFAIGGGMYAVQSMLQTKISVLNGSIVTVGNGYGHPVTWLFIFIGWPLVWWFTRKTLHSIQTRGAITKHYARIKVIVGEHSFTCTGLVDTGNQLRDPITRAPVVIVESNLLKEIMPSTFVQAFQRDCNDWNEMLNVLDDEWARRFRMIPFRSVSKNNQFLMAIKPDKMIVWLEEHPIECSKVLIGIDNGHLSVDGSYRAIIHPSLIAA